jgi:hypothetical protein
MMRALFELLAKAPAEVIEGVGRTVIAIFKGDTAGAVREARVATETVIAKKAIVSAFELGKFMRAQAGGK